MNQKRTSVFVDDSYGLPRILGQLRIVRGPDRRGEHVAWCPFHADGQGKPPHTPNLHVSERGFICHACGEKGSLPALAKRLGLQAPADPPRDERAYDYRDTQGKLLFQVVRRPGKKFLQRRPDDNGGWIWNLHNVQRVLYRLPDLSVKSEDPVFVVEGEKDADRLCAEGLVATTNPGGAGKWRAEYNALLQGRDVVLIPDNDAPGRRHMEQVAQALAGAARSVKVLDLPDLPPKGDVCDWLNAGHTAEQLQALAGEAEPGDRPQQPTPRTRTDARADGIVNLVTDSGALLFHDERGEAYAAVAQPAGRSILAIRSPNFGHWLGRLVWELTGKAPSGPALASARQVLAGIANFDGPKHPLHVRCAWHEEAIWVDLDGRRAVRIQPGEWEVVEKPPILFRSLPHQTALPMPVRGGDPRRVLGFLNVSDAQTELLLLCFLTAAFVPDIPIPALLVHGIQGSAKTTLLKIVKRLVDPSRVEVRGGVKSLDEFALAAWQTRALFFDNLTGVPQWLSDALCRAVTGEGWSKRTNYTDEDSTVFAYRRIVGLTGINLVAERADLLDRSLIVPLQPVDQGKRVPEEVFWRMFEQSRPRILGGLFETLACAMENKDRLTLREFPRMADFAWWGAAAAEALGHGADEFLTAYAQNVGRQNEAALDASPVAQAVIAFMETRDRWEGTPGALLEQLDHAADALHIDRKSRSWPKQPNWLTRRLREVQPNLSAVGIHFDQRRSMGRNIAILGRVAQAVVSDDNATPDPEM